MKINNIFTTGTLWLASLINCCGCLNATQERVEAVKGSVLQELVVTRAAFDIGGGEIKITVAMSIQRPIKLSKSGIKAPNLCS